MSMMGFVTYLLETMCQGNQKTFLMLTLIFYSKTLIRKIKHIFLLFLFKNLQHFLYQKLESLKVSTRSKNMNLFMDA